MSKVVQFNENQIVYSSQDDERYRVPLGDKYEVSIISTPYSYGGKMGLYEIALIKAGKLAKLRGKAEGFRDDDVLGYLTEDDVRKYIEILASLSGRGGGLNEQMVYRQNQSSRAGLA